LEYAIEQLQFDSAMTIKRIVPNISSNKLEESKEFYINFLGLTLAMDMKWVLTFVSGSNPTAQITIVQSDKEDNSSSNITLSIEVSDIDELYEKAKALNYEIIYEITNEPWGVRRFFVKDPNGVTINLMTHIK
jgi:predicted enzyme related to lactoylglutathione lyase